MKEIRLDKYLADMKAGSRSAVRELIKKGRVRVNGIPEKDASRKVRMDSEITLDGTRIGYAEYEYFMLNKPGGVVSATEDCRYPTVISLIKDSKRKDLFPVGRLDVDTEGLLLITNDGGLAHRLLSPAHHVDKTYYAEVDGDVTDEAVSALEKGILLHEEDKDEITMPAVVEVLDSRKVLLTIQEGRFHQVKRMFAAVGLHVEYLKRMTMGPLRLDPKLKLGEYRPLTEEEKEALSVVS